ncbi:hypothetical protein EXIGLDRAFT_565472, partial [Exidia glandulosa HHB12029]
MASVTMYGKQAARLLQQIEAEVLVPMHYDLWTQFIDELRMDFENAGLHDKVCCLTPG